MRPRRRFLEDLNIVARQEELATINFSLPFLLLWLGRFWLQYTEILRDTHLTTLLLQRMLLQGEIFLQSWVSHHIPTTTQTVDRHNRSGTATIRTFAHLQLIFID